jgi:hypothetical protein
MNEIDCRTNAPLEIGQVIQPYSDCGLPRQMKEIFANSTLSVSAWSGAELIGISRE